MVNGTLAEHYDLYTGGGLGTTHNLPETQQLLGLYLGRVPREQVVDTVRAIAILQKEHGERKNRRQARWKYTLRRLGVDPVKAALRERFGIRLMEAEPQPIPEVRYHHGWHPEAGDHGHYYYGLPVENGRLRNLETAQMRTAVRRIVEELDLGVRVTPNQDLLLCHIPADRRGWVEQVLKEHGVNRPAWSLPGTKAFPQRSHSNSTQHSGLGIAALPLARPARLPPTGLERRATVPPACKERKGPSAPAGLSTMDASGRVLRDVGY